MSADGAARRPYRGLLKTISRSNSFGSELRAHSIETCENAIFSHHFEHVIKTRANAPATHCDSGRVNQIGRLAAELLRGLLQGRFQFLHGPGVETIKGSTQRD